MKLDYYEGYQNELMELKRDFKDQLIALEVHGFSTTDFAASKENLPHGSRRGFAATIKHFITCGYLPYNLELYSEFRTYLSKLVDPKLTKHYKTDTDERVKEIIQKLDEEF